MIPHISALAASQAFEVFGDPKDDRRKPMCDAERQLAKARHLLELMRGNGVYDIPQLSQALTHDPCQHQTRSE